MKKNFTLLIILTIVCCTQAQTITDTLTAYPNPFSDTATIAFTSFTNDTVTLKMYSSVGAVVKTFFQSTFLPQGTYSLTLIGDSLPLGMYIVALNGGNNLAKAIKLLKTNPVNSLSESENKNNCYIYPNPANETISLKNIQPNTLITITNITGNIVLQTTLKKINISHLTSGIYFIQAQSKNYTQTTKFIKQ